MKLRTETTPEGEQTLVPGVKPMTDADRLAKLADKPLAKPRQKPCDVGLFDDDTRNQADLFDE